MHKCNQLQLRSAQDVGQFLMEYTRKSGTCEARLDCGRGGRVHLPGVDASHHDRGGRVVEEKEVSFVV